MVSGIIPVVAPAVVTFGFVFVQSCCVVVTVVGARVVVTVVGARVKAMGGVAAGGPFAGVLVGPSIGGRCFDIGTARSCVVLLLCLDTRRHIWRGRPFRVELLIVFGVT